MMKLTKLFMLIIVMGMMMVGCSDNSNPLINEDSTTAGAKSIGGFSLAEYGTLESATFHLYVNIASNRVVNVHRITDPWLETVVTWNNFNRSYMNDIFGSFQPDHVGWYEVDITTLVEGWMAGTYDNYGFLLAQSDHSYPRQVYNSRENAMNQPYLEICFTNTDGTTCETIVPFADAMISEYYPDQNFGKAELLITGWPDPTGVEKQSIFKFEIEPYETDDGCTFTIGYWKNHAGFGPQADMVSGLLPVWLGTAEGAQSLHVTTAAMAVDVLVQKTYGRPSNGITKLYAQLLGAKLNIATGAGYSDVDDIIAAADEFLAEHDWMDWDGLSIGDRNMVLNWHDMLDDYNNGLIGPGHCDREDNMFQNRHGFRHNFHKHHKK